MLNDYGIQHFHLGTRPDPRRPHLIEGDKEVLFAIVKDNDFYAIGIYGHEWTKQQVLEVAHQTWPSLTEPFTIKGVVGLSRKHTDEEAARLRAGNVNIAYQRSDGTIHMGMGGGIMANGTSLAVRREADRLIIHAEELQAAVEGTLRKHVEAGRIPADAVVRVVWDGNDTYAVADPGALKVNLSGQLAIPPL